MQLSVRQAIEDFLSYRRLAMVGVSRDAADFSRALFRTLQERGYSMVPVNPHAQEIEGQRCYANVQEIQPPVDGALVMTPAAQTDQVVRDCAAAGIHQVWLYQSIGHGAVTESAVQFCREQGIAVIPGECPFMYLAKSGWIHAAHRYCRRMAGTFPT